MTSWGCFAVFSAFMDQHPQLFVVFCLLVICLLVENRR